jgi:hypothetical protein
MVRTDSDAAESAVSRFLNSLLALALLCFAVASHYRNRAEGTAQPERRAAGAKFDPALTLRQAAETSLARAASEHCLAHARDCLALSQRLGAEAARGADK